ncbi:plasmolipin-like [Centruroides sculpturatus]|uniref:plasmolipin-like n=1 Tax=Centruroides sculpturatus TaxID=218467 RepID=UPI000C6DF52E|nr:plasmolipin-like [Centruroides sculpturatus]
MPHTVTVRTTTTATTGTFNAGFLKSWPGILKLLETVIGAVVLGLVAYYGTHFNTHSIDGFGAKSEHTYLFLVSFGCLLPTLLLLVTSVSSVMSSTLIPKTLFEVVFNVFAFLLYLSAGLALLIVLIKQKHHYLKDAEHDGKIAASVLGLINAVLYATSTSFSYKAYKNTCS